MVCREIIAVYCVNHNGIYKLTVLAKRKILLINLSEHIVTTGG